MAPWKNNRAALPTVPFGRPADAMGSPIALLSGPLRSHLLAAEYRSRVSIADKAILGAKEFPFGRHTLCRYGPAVHYPVRPRGYLSVFPSRETPRPIPMSSESLSNCPYIKIRSCFRAVRDKQFTPLPPSPISGEQRSFSGGHGFYIATENFCTVLREDIYERHAKTAQSR